MPFDQVCYDYGIINDGNNINFGMLKEKPQTSQELHQMREKEREKGEREIS